MMLLYKGGQKVGKGTYWNIANGFRVDAAGNELLPGERGTAYLRIVPGVMFLAGPVIGLLYFLFLPIVTIGMVVQLAAKKVWAVLASLVGNLAYFEWRPTESYLAGDKKNRKKVKKS
ncbi:MAG: hypothetical protein AABY87_08105 [bacterium]